MSEFGGIDVVILAGGQGTRLRTVLRDKPKAMADIKGKPFISLLFDQLIHIGLHKVVVSTGYKGHIIRKYFDNYYENMELIYSNESQPLGTGGALKLAQDKLEKTHVLVMNGDTLVDFDLKEFLAYHTKKPNEVTILLCQMVDASRYGAVEIDRRGKVLSFMEKAEGITNVLVNAGVYLIQRRCLKIFPEEKRYSLEHEFIPSMVGRDLFGFINEKPVFDIGTPEAYREFLSSRELEAQVR